MEYRILKDYPNYRIYEDGTVIRMEHTSAKGSLLKEKKNKVHKLKNKYLTVYMHDKNGTRKQFYLHRLVYEAFFDEIPKGYEIDHINGNREDCSLQSIRLCTHKANCRNPQSLERYKKANALCNGKFDRQKMQEAKSQEKYDMLKQTYLSLKEKQGSVGVWQLMKEGHCGYQRALKVIREMSEN